jgi:hypothetical protein
VARLRERAAGAHVRQRIERVAHDAPRHRHRHEPGEERPDVEGAAHGLDVGARQSGVDEALADVGDVNASMSWKAPAMASLSSRSVLCGASARAKFSTR